LSARSAQEVQQSTTDIEAVETAYEFLLAYAAQGRADDATGPGRKSREVVNELDAALANILGWLDKEIDFSSVVEEDISKTRKALALVLAQPNISSELIDNLNASMHLRAVLTDLFLLSETI
ncbi:MAG: hypothetical protein V3T18_04080, partial [Pseudomonadales bacterium]